MSKIAVAVIGAGTMGQGIAQLALQAGHHVYLIDQSKEQLKKAKASLNKLFTRFVEKGKISEKQAKAWIDRLTLSEKADIAADAGLVIEAIVERMDIKQSVFSDLEKIVSTKAILASNTSSLSITEIASALSLPKRFMGLHFFNPPGIMPLVEVVKAVQSEESYVAQAVELMQQWGKTPVRCKDTPSFIVNRVARPYYVESFRLLEENALCKRNLDAALRTGMNFKMGPCELTDFIGQDVNYAVSESLWSALGYPPHLQPSFVQGDLVAAKYLGRKTKRGFYHYDTDEKAPLPENNAPVVAFADTVDSSNKHIGDLINGVAVYRTDGRRAADWEKALDKPVALIDIADNAKPNALAIAYSPKAKKLMNGRLPETQRLAKRWIMMPDRPGLVNLRVISMIINEAATVALLDIADEDGIDAALQGGVNYPKGAFVWLHEIGINTVCNTLDALENYYGSARYKASPYLKDKFEEQHE